MPGPLSHLKVLDMSRVLAGPWCGQLLSDLGAEVIKIERPGDEKSRGGDDTRTWGPPYLKDAAGRDTTEAAYYLSANRGKKSLTVDISTPEGQEIIRQLAAKSDIVLENYKVGQLKKYGLDYAGLKAVNPRLIYCSITGFGQTGPYAHRAGYDYVIQGMGGFMSITGERDDLPGGGPQKAGVAVADLMTGMYSGVAILAAITHREQTGEGQYIDMALLDCQVAMLANMNTNYLTSGKAPARAGNSHQNLTPYQVFKVADGYVIVAVGNDGQFARYCQAGGRPELASDPRFRTNPDRVRNRAGMIPLLEVMMLEKTRQQWIDELEAVGVPCGPINSIADAFDNPQVKARGLKIELAHPTAGKVPLVANPIKYSGTPLEYAAPPPLLGEHTEAVLRELGYAPEQIARMRERFIV
ncbi:MAG TPA: CaiB/BaiF CoA-transferase family protein [Burkholderiales bacterium]